MWNTEFEAEMNEYEGENFEFGQELFGEMSGEYEGEASLNETMEMELAAELLSVTNEAELEQFLGGLFKKAAGFIKSPVGRALGGVLKGIAKKALPVVGGALGSFIAPGIGTSIGSSLGSAASNLFELEMEGLSNEDREFEVARRVVRLASTAARHAAKAPANVNPVQVARKSVFAAARRHAPGLAARLVRPPQRTRVAPQQGQAAMFRPASRYPQFTPRKPSAPFQPTWGGSGDIWSAPADAAPVAAMQPQPAWSDEPQSNVQQPSFWGDEPLWNAPAEPSFAPIQSGRWVRRGRQIIIIGA